MTRVLVTGGAGFIGSHLADALLARSDDVTLLDTLDPQVHGPEQRTPEYLDPRARLVVGDVRDEALLGGLVADAEVIVHLAAHTGVGQSGYQIRQYLDVNSVGIAALLEQLIRSRRDVRLVVASSRAVYGEGAYRCSDCGRVSPLSRDVAQLARGEWEVRCPSCIGSVQATATPENEPTRPASVYALSKLDQERLSQLIGGMYGLPVVTLRYFNVYGPRQSLGNPYTGVVTTFVTRALNGLAPEVYEDGLESRDFVHVSDVVRATIAAVDQADVIGGTFNVGSGTPTTLRQVAGLVSSALGAPDPVVTGRFRLGDIRHCWADLTHASSVLGYHPAVDAIGGITELARGLADEHHEDLSGVAEAELAAHGLLSVPGRQTIPHP